MGTGCGICRRRDAWDSSCDARERVLSADATRGEATRGERRALLVRLEYVDGDGRTNRRSNSANTRWREKPCKRSRKGNRSGINASASTARAEQIFRREKNSRFFLESKISSCVNFQSRRGIREFLGGETSRNEREFRRAISSFRIEDIACPLLSIQLSIVIRERLTRRLICSLSGFLLN